MVTRLALVDDDQNILTSVALMLEAEGYEVDTYFDSEQALSGLLRRPLRWNSGYQNAANGWHRIAGQIAPAFILAGDFPDQ